MSNTPSYIFDHSLAKKFRLRAAKKNQNNKVANNDFLLKYTATDLEDRLAFVSRFFKNALDIYSHNDIIANCLSASGKVENIERVEAINALTSAKYVTHIADNETLTIEPDKYDLITSVLALQNINDIPGLLIRIRKALMPDGLFLAALCGTGTLGELREALLQAESEIYGGATPHIAPLPDVREAGALLQRADFALPVADTEDITVWYDNMFSLMQDLKSWGMQNSLLDRRKTPLSRKFFLRAAEIYTERFSNTQGKIKASFSIIWLSGWAPHKNQQKPMRPGSAQASLAEALQDSSKK